ncbi:uromodulin-like, partial [Orbicella faveolata]|uniref:uromodulin-like n=1 Tax=Orbicella faveolata TaxID=48498 RepID=UPI0009E40E14
CHSLASCTNTVGSFSCSCNHPYTGDGKTCRLAAECQNYQTLNSADRKTNYFNSQSCDNGLRGWYRFQGAAGSRMPTSCPPTSKCNAPAPGWLNGAHPAVPDGKVTRKVCFHWSSNCCNWSTNIEVRNCSSFYVYYFNGTPSCYLRYCGTD